MPLAAPPRATWCRGSCLASALTCRQCSGTRLASTVGRQTATWVRAKCLCLPSHLLGLTLRRLNPDWSSRYGHEFQLLEIPPLRDGPQAGTLPRLIAWTTLTMSLPKHACPCLSRGCTQNRGWLRQALPVAIWSSPGTRSEERTADAHKRASLYCG